MNKRLYINKGLFIHLVVTIAVFMCVIYVFEGIPEKQVEREATIGYALLANFFTFMAIGLSSGIDTHKSAYSQRIKF